MKRNMAVLLDEMSKTPPSLKENLKNNSSLFKGNASVRFKVVFKKEKKIYLKIV